MKIYSLFVAFFLMSFSSTGQNYHFDYLLEYKVENYIDSTKNHIIYFYTNSKDNSHIVQIWEKDSIIFNMSFIDKDKISSYFQVKKKDILEGNKIIIHCNNLYKNSNIYKYKAKDYEFIKSNLSTDTLSVIEVVCLKSEKYKKRKKIGKSVYTFDLKSPKFKPFLVFPTVYEIWKTNPILPNNFLIEEKYYNHNNILESKTNITYYEINIDLEIKWNDDCEIQKNWITN